MASTDPQFRALPAPWTCKGAHAWWFFTSLGLPSFGSGTPKLHPSYFYDGGAGQKDFVGGPATLMLLRYDSTPAGMPQEGIMEESVPLIDNSDRTIR